MDYSKLDEDSEALAEAAHAIKQKIAKMKLNEEIASSRDNSLNAADKTIKIRYKKN